MTVIVHAPQGAGKTLHAEALRVHFGKRAALEDHEPPLGNGGIWHILANPQYHERLKALDALVLTHTKPPKGLQLAEDTRVQVYTLQAALKLAGIKRTKAPTAAAAPKATAKTSARKTAAKGA